MSLYKNSLYLVKAVFYKGYSKSWIAGSKGVGTFQIICCPCFDTPRLLTYKLVWPLALKTRIGARTAHNLSRIHYSWEPLQTQHSVEIDSIDCEIINLFTNSTFAMHANFAIVVSRGELYYVYTLSTQIHMYSCVLWIW